MAEIVFDERLEGRRQFVSSTEEVSARLPRTWPPTSSVPPPFFERGFSRRNRLTLSELR